VLGSRVAYRRRMPDLTILRLARWFDRQLNTCAECRTLPRLATTDGGRFCSAACNAAAGDRQAGLV
jgi:hypothetical protein